MSVFDDMENLPEAYKKLLEEYAKRDMDKLTFFMHPDTRKQMALEPIFRDGELESLDIVQSRHVAPGDIYMVPQHKVRPSRNLRLEPPLPGFNTEELNKAILGLYGGIVNFGRSMAMLGEHGPEIFTPAEVKAYRWERKDGETLMVWAIRLEERGLLDNPEIRIQYQKAVAVGLLTWIRDMLWKT